MYEHLRGTLTSKNLAQAVVDVGGVGYALLIPLSTFEKLPREGAETLLLVELVVREDAHRLYGFATPAERSFFRALQGVTGVGPSVALGIISSIPFAAFRSAVMTGDAAQLRRVKGVGKRLSERLVVELRDTVEKLAPGAPLAPSDAAASDALLALEALGFTRPAAEKALTKLRKSAPDVVESGELVRLALQLL